MFAKVFSTIVLIGIFVTIFILSSTNLPLTKQLNIPFIETISIMIISFTSTLGFVISLFFLLSKIWKEGK